jgi:hypothetical protein
MTSVAEPGREAGNDTAAGVSGLSAAALASWGNADVERDSNRRPAGCDRVPGGFERRLSSGDLALERRFRAVSTPAHSQGGAAPSCGPPPALQRRASTRCGAPLPRARQRPHTRGAAGPPGRGAAPVEQAELERQLSSSRSAPPLRPAAARGWPARRRPPAARSSGRPNSRRPARGAAWPSRRPGS